MSGSGGGDVHHGGTYELDCDAVSIITTLSSPDQEALTTVVVGQRLALGLKGNILVVLAPETEMALGSVNHPKVRKLIGCMRKGYEYWATIRKVQDGLIRVHIHS